MRAKFVNESIKHLPGRSEEEVSDNMKNMTDKEIYVMWIKTCTIPEEKFLYDELKRRNAISYVDRIKAINTQLLIAKRPYINESIKHLPGRSPEEINTLTQFINNVRPENDSKYCEDFTFHQNNANIIECIKKNIYGISSNEIERFMAFTLQDIISEIPTYLFRDNNLEAINKYVERGIESWSKSWMAMHSDNSMRQMMRNSGMR